MVFETFCAKQYRVVLVHLHDILQLYSCIYSCQQVYICVSCASHRAHAKFDKIKWRSTIETTPCCPLPIPFIVQRVKYFAQVLMCKSSLVTIILSSFIPLLSSQLAVFWINYHSVHAQFAQSHTIVAQSRDHPTIVRNLEIGMQSQESENAQCNLEIAQILRLCRTQFLGNVNQCTLRLVSSHASAYA